MTLCTVPQLRRKIWAYLIFHQRRQGYYISLACLAVVTTLTLCTILFKDNHPKDHQERPHGKSFNMIAKSIAVGIGLHDLSYDDVTDRAYSQLRVEGIMNSYQYRSLLDKIEQAMYVPHARPLTDEVRECTIVT